MIDISKLREGTQVYGNNNQLFGTVERISGNDIYISGKRYPLSSFSRFEQNRLYMGQQGGTSAQQGSGEIKVPIVEEQLNVGKRQVELGEVELQKKVTQEQVNIPVELRREEVHVQEVDIPDRPIQAGEAAFQEGTIRVPVRGEEAQVNKQAVVTGEVVVNKNVVTEQQQVADTVRKERVTVDKNFSQDRGQAATGVDYDRAGANQAGYDRSDYEAVQADDTTGMQDTAGRSDTTTGAGTSGYGQVHPEEGMEVISSDGDHVGKVKEVSDSYFRVGRGLFKSDIEASYTSIQEVSEDQVILNLSKEQISDLT
jgi:uncharacterized protein (TIGR02271 family)